MDTDVESRLQESIEHFGAVYGQLKDRDDAGLQEEVSRRILAQLIYVRDGNKPEENDMDEIIEG